tara:strand:- start:193 stop:327 length:135 start_codon:yes stop_codon:yes gene_type:complete
LLSQKEKKENVKIVIVNAIVKMNCIYTMIIKTYALATTVNVEDK